MSDKDDADCAFSMRNCVNSICLLSLRFRSLRLLSLRLLSLRLLSLRLLSLRLLSLRFLLHFSQKLISQKWIKGFGSTFGKGGIHL